MKHILYSQCQIGKLMNAIIGVFKDEKRVMHIFRREGYQTVLFERRQCIISLDKSHVQVYHIACESRRQYFGFHSRKELAAWKQHLVKASSFAG